MKGLRQPLVLLKYVLFVFKATVSLCLAATPPDGGSQAGLPQIRKEHEEKHDKDGQVVASIDTIFRGNERIILTVILTTNISALRMTRSYFIDGKTVLDELHYADGTQKIRLWKNEVLYDEFKQAVDGSVEPVKSEDLVTPTTQPQEIIQAASAEHEPKHRWIASPWSYLAVAWLVLVPLGLRCFLAVLRRQAARTIAALPPEERERRLASMTPRQREAVSNWMRS